MFDPTGNIHCVARHACWSVSRTLLTLCPSLHRAFVAYISQHERNNHPCLVDMEQLIKLLDEYKAVFSLACFQVARHYKRPQYSN